MVATVIAVLGTLLGAVVSGLFQHRSAGRSEQEARRQELRRDQLNAIKDLAEAIDNHRSVMWQRGDAKLQGDEDRYRELRSKSHETRGKVTNPLVALKILITDPGVRVAAERMVDRTYAMRNHDHSAQVLTESREQALAAHTEFVDVAAHFIQAQAA